MTNRIESNQHDIVPIHFFLNIFPIPRIIVLLYSFIISRTFCPFSFPRILNFRVFPNQTTLIKQRPIEHDFCGDAAVLLAVKLFFMQGPRNTKFEIWALTALLKMRTHDVGQGLYKYLKR